MEKLLTNEEKKYLRRVTNYLRSLGLRSGELEFEMDTYDSGIDYDSINWDYITYFSNNWTAEIPSGLVPILQKIIKYSSDERLFGETAPDADEMIWQKFEITINCDSKDISLIHYWSWYDKEDGNSTSWDDDEGVEIFDEWEKDGVLETIEVPSDGVLTLKYNGGGDSGYIEDLFDENGQSVPNLIENWCYRQLETNYGGWEINEGSDGKFIFDFNRKEITLDHAYNVEESASDTLWEESFGVNDDE